MLNLVADYLCHANRVTYVTVTAIVHQTAIAADQRSGGIRRCSMAATKASPAVKDS